MIRIKNLTFTYPGSQTPQLAEVDLVIEKGEFIAVIGENGCGKSTLCKSMNGLIPHYFNGDYEGEVEILGKIVRNSSISELAQIVGYVYQDFENQIIRPTLIDDASFGCMNFAYPDFKERGQQALAKMGLGDRQNDYIWQLSGGQKHLLALASVAALEPEVLVLDEPIAQLDPRHAEDIYNLLEQMNKEENKTIIVIEHHSEFIARYCSHVVMMHQGKVVWKLPVKEAMNRIEELQAVNVYPPQVTLAAYGMKHSKQELLPITLEEGLLHFEDIRKHKKDGKTIISSLGIKVETINRSSTKTVEIRDLSVEYATVKGPKTRIFEHLNLDMYKNENIGIVGNNGAGKTTLFKLMTGLVRPAQGTIHIRGTNTTRMSPEKISNMVSLVYQNPEQMFISDSISRDIMHAMKARKMADYEEKGKELLERFELTGLKDRDGRLLSGGQMRRASLAIGIALQPSVLLLDEPTANLDIATRKGIIRMLSSMKGIVDTAVIASHDMQLIAEWADRILVLNHGEIIADGTREEIFSDTLLMKKAGIVPPKIYELARGLDEDAQCFTLEEFLNSFAMGGVG